MKRWIGLSLVLILVLASLLWEVTRKEPEVARSDRIYSVALALASGGLGDRAYNDSAYEGLLTVEPGIRTRVCEYRGVEEQPLGLMELAQERYDLIVAVGFENAQPVQRAAYRFPETRFALIDAIVEAPNVSSVVFHEREGDFLVGALSAFLAGDRAVAFLGGDDDATRATEDAWRQGVLHARPHALILAAFLKSGSPASVAQSIADDLYRQGAHVVYAASETAAEGALGVAESHKALLINTSSDLRVSAPDAVVTSRTKNVGAAVRLVVEDLRSGRLDGGVRVLGLGSGAIAVAPVSPPYSSQELTEAMHLLELGLQRGEIQVLEYSTEPGR